MRQEVESLLAHSETSDAFLEKPAMHLAAKQHARDEAKWKMAGKTMSHYRVIQELGAGGMGVVYLARDETLDRKVALKVLPTGSLADETAHKRLRKEALALAKLRAFCVPGRGPAARARGAGENFVRFNGYVSAYLGNAELTRCLNHTRKTSCTSGNGCALIVNAHRLCDMAQLAEAAACPAGTRLAPGREQAPTARSGGSRVHAVYYAPPALYGASGKRQRGDARGIVISPK
jgi:hypothetical protein